MAPSAAAGTTGLERVLLIFLMKNQQIKLQRTRPSPANDRFSNQSVKKLSNSQELPGTQPQQHADRFGRKTFTETCVLSTNLLLLRQNSRFTGQKHERTAKDFDLPIKTRTISEKLQLSAQELERTRKNFNSPNKTQANGEKPQSTEHKLKRTVKNVKLPIKTSNER